MFNDNDIYMTPDQFKKTMDAPSVLLMCRNDPVIRFHQSKGELEVLNTKLVPYALRGQIINIPDSDDPNITVRMTEHNNNIFKSFIARRVLSLTRSNAKKLMNAFHFSQNDDVDTKYKIALTCHGVSMSDSYWLKTEDNETSWGETNIRKVSLSKIVASIALDGKSLTISGDPAPKTPEFLTKGIFAKAWTRNEDGFCYLKKRGLFGRDLEPKSEVEASNVMNHFNVNHVNYKLIHDKYGYMSICRCAATDNTGMVDASELQTRFNRYEHSQDNTFSRYIIKHDKINFYKLLIMDYLCSNSDRHPDNWGFFQNYNTGKLTALYPIMDLNQCFDDTVMSLSDGGECYPLYDMGLSQKEAAHMAIKEIGIPIISDVTKDDFFYEEHYDSYRNRFNVLKSLETKKTIHIPSPASSQTDTKHDTFEKTAYSTGRILNDSTNDKFSKDIQTVLTKSQEMLDDSRKDNFPEYT